VARPLREQFVIATLLLLVPVGIVMTLASNLAHQAQGRLLYEESAVLGGIIARHLEVNGPETEATLRTFLGDLPLSAGSAVFIRDAKGREVIVQKYPVDSKTDIVDRIGELVTVHGLGWSVKVELPSSSAESRSRAETQRTIIISGLATLIVLAVQLVFLGRLLPALVSLERSTARVGAGDLGVPFAEPMPARELEHLRDAFHDMVDKLRAARESIAHQVEEERHMRHELESLQQQVIRQERLAAIGVLVSGIAHELNNPLQAISGFSELLQNDPQIGSRARADLDLIHQESTRAGAIIRNLSRFGRQRESAPMAVSLSEVISSVIELRQRRLTDQNIRLQRDELATQTAHAVFTELQQVALNFVINAEQSVRSRETGDRYIILRTRDDADGVRLEVEDSGPGVDPENEAKLFQPFFTTKPVGEGTGLGLSVSYGIIRSLGGTIGYRRGDLGGALFYFIVPRSTV
jgi:C4-dicarboxylate-specific signal transduction histidine kinase